VKVALADYLQAESVAREDYQRTEHVAADAFKKTLELAAERQRIVSNPVSNSVTNGRPLVDPASTSSSGVVDDAPPPFPFHPDHSLHRVSEKLRRKTPAPYSRPSKANIRPDALTNQRPNLPSRRKPAPSSGRLSSACAFT
jgi:hypothetical protein